MMKEISTAFVKAQKEFGAAHKTSNNPFFKSKYADLTVVVDAVLGALNNNGIALIQNCHESDTGVVVETIFLHESGQTISCGKLSVPAAKNDPQGYGSALTYARRYSLMAACGIAPEDDDGNAATSAVKSQPKPEPVDAKEVSKARSELGVAAEFGTSTLKGAWSKLPESIRNELKEELGQFKVIAEKQDIATQA